MNAWQSTFGNDCVKTIIFVDNVKLGC